MRHVTIILITLCLLQTLPASEYLWWEAEATTASNFPTIQDEGQAGHAVLSGGEWIGGTARTWPAGPNFLTYDLDLAVSDSYDFYVRKFWKHGSFRWRFDDGPWHEMPHKRTVLLDGVEIRTHCVVNWVPLGTVDLTAGRHRLHLEMDDGDKPIAFFDCFLLINDHFAARGKMRPETPYPPAPDGWYNFQPTRDHFTEEALIDLRGLNEAQAGDGGFIRAEGDHFVQSDSGETIRFLGVGAGHKVIQMPHTRIDQLCRFLAKHGINLVRFHGAICQASGPEAFAIDDEMLDDLFYFQAACKRNGIYLHLSIYFQHWMKLFESEGFTDYAEPPFRNRHPFVLHFFDPRFQAHMRDWWKALLTRVNPHTGLRLVDDPAVMSAELLNEDSFFFWTFKDDYAPPAKRALLEQDFYAWTIARHHSLAAAMRAWGDETRPEDQPEAGRLQLMPVWRFIQNPQQPTPFSPRTLDTLAFLAEVQTDFFRSMRDHLRAIGFRGAICSSNWRTADAKTLDPVEKSTNLTTDFMDYHGYFSAPIQRKQGTFLAVPGDRLADRSLIRRDPPMAPGGKRFLGWPRFDPTFLDMVYNGQPSMVSEFTMMHQNRYRAELPLVGAALFAQAGIDAPIYFSLDSRSGWRNDETSHWPLQSPAEMSQMWAMAHIFRRGLVAETPPAMRVVMSRADVLGLKGSPVVTANSVDDNRAQEVQARGEVPVDFKIFAIGKVAMDIVDEGTTQVDQVDLAAYDDQEAGRLHGLKRETVWDYRRHVYEIRSPQAQAAIGFLGAAGPIDCGHVVFDMANEHAAIAAIALDDQTLEHSRRILLNVFSRQRNTGFAKQDLDDGSYQLIDLGSAPLQIEELRGTVRFQRPDADAMLVQPCDINGYPVGAAQRGAAEISLDPRITAYLLTTD